MEPRAMYARDCLVAPLAGERNVSGMRHRVRIGLLEQVCGLLKETASWKLGFE
jgi:hypothetical protein